MSARRADVKAKKQQKKKVRRQTGRAQAGAVARGGRPLDKYAWLQVWPACPFCSLATHTTIDCSCLCAYKTALAAFTGRCLISEQYWWLMPVQQSACINHVMPALLQAANLRLGLPWLRKHDIILSDWICMNKTLSVGAPSWSPGH